MKFLVTGGAGFQGSHISQYLAKKRHQVTILNHRSPLAVRNIASFKDSVTVVWGSVVDRHLVARLVAKHDVVLHLAAKIHVEESIANPQLYVEKNVAGTFSVLEALKIIKRNRPRLIYWSSCEVYGQPKTTRLSEDSILQPHSPYAATKVAAERLCFAYYKTYGINVTIIRPFNIFGARQKIGTQGSLISTMVENAINKVPIVVQGEGKQTRDYLYITDLLTALDIVLKHKELCGQAINFASQKDTSVIAIARYIAKKFAAKIVFAPGRPGEVMRFPADITKARHLGFRPTVPIWQGIDRYIDWRLSQKSFSPAPAKYSDWLLLRRLYEKFLPRS